MYSTAHDSTVILWPVVLSVWLYVNQLSTNRFTMQVVCFSKYCHSQHHSNNVTFYHSWACLKSSLIISWYILQTAAKKWERDPTSRMYIDAHSSDTIGYFANMLLVSPARIRAFPVIDDKEWKGTFWSGYSSGVTEMNCEPSCWEMSRGYYLP